MHCHHNPNRIWQTTQKRAWPNTANAQLRVRPCEVNTTTIVFRQALDVMLGKDCVRDALLLDHVRVKILQDKSHKLVEAHRRAYWNTTSLLVDRNVRCWMEVSRRLRRIVESDW